MLPCRLSSQSKHDSVKAPVAPEQPRSRDGHSHSSKTPNCMETAKKRCGGEVHHCKACANPALAPEGSDPAFFRAAELQESTGKT